MSWSIAAGCLPRPITASFRRPPCPPESIEVTGVAIVPGQRFFNLAPQPASGWEPVWQNLNLERLPSGRDLSAATGGHPARP
jgi:surfeit locus 1 family protein